MTDWAWRDDGIITIQIVGDKVAVGANLRSTLVPTSQLASTYVESAYDENTKQCDNGICAATSITYQRLKQDARSWSDFVRILCENPILSVMVSNQANAHDREPAVYRIVDTMAVCGTKNGRDVAPQEVASEICSWIIGLSTRLGPQRIHKDVQEAHKAVLPAIRAMSEDFCDLKIAGKMEDHHIGLGMTDKTLGSIELCYSIVDNKLLRYPNTAKPSIVGCGLKIEGFQSFKYGLKGLDRSRSFFEVTAELNAAEFDVFHKFTAKKVMETISSSQTGSMKSILSAHRMSEKELGSFESGTHNQSMSPLPTLPIPLPSRKCLASPDGMRLRLLTLFALYDALPHSIANSPDGDSPMDLDSAIEATAVQSCLQSMEEQGRLSVDEAQALSATYAPLSDVVEEAARKVS